MARLNENEIKIVTKMLTSHAYREKLAAQRFQQAVDLSPTIEDKNYIKHIIEEELFHYQGCLNVAKELDIELEQHVNARMCQDPAGIPPFEDWLDVLLAHSLNDRAGYHVIGGIIGSKISSYAKLALEIVTEEELHGENGAAFLTQYYPQCNDPRKREKLINHIDAAIRCLGKPSSQNDSEAIKLGLKTKPSKQIIEEFCETVDPILVSIGCQDLVPLSSHYLK